MRIAVLDDYQRVARDLADWDTLAGCEIEFLHEPMLTQAEVISRLADFDGVVAMRERTRFPAEVLRSLPRLRLLLTTGMKNRAIDMAAAAECGIVVCGTPWAEDATVELTWGLILGLAHAIPVEDASLRAGRWQSSLGLSLKGKTLGIVGLGTIGSKVARIGQAFGMRVIAYSPNLTEERAAALDARAVSRQLLFSQADVVSIHLILGETTRGIVGAAEFSLMKASAFLINTSRGALVDEQALADALRRGQLRGAGVDVYTQEPIQPDHPLLGAPGTILTPHIGYVTEEVYAAWYQAAVEGVAAYLRGQPLRVLS